MLKHCQTAIILAGGKSSRMGFDKINIPFNEGRLIDYQVQLLKPLFQEIIIVSNTLSHYEDEHVKVVSDVYQNKGPLAGLHVGLKNASSDYAYVIACDMPTIYSEFIKKLDQLLQVGQVDGLVAKVNGYVEPFQAIYHKGLVTQIENWFKTDEKIGLKDLIEHNNFQYLDPFILNLFDVNMFHNWNSPEDIKQVNNQQDFIEKSIVDIKQVKSGHIVFKEDVVIREYPFTIYLNDEEFITLLCTPKSLKELTIGFLYSEGFIRKYEDLKELFINEQDGVARVQLNSDIELIKKMHGKRARTTGCGKGSMFYHAIDAIQSKKINSYLKISYQKIIELSRDFNKMSELFLETGGVHSTMLFNENEVVCFYEDVGRHNTIDKIIGYSLLNKVNLMDKAIYTSGRISSEMLLKALKARIPMIISRSAPTDLAVQLAKEYGVTLVGFVRGDRMNIYHDVNRIDII